MYVQLFGSMHVISQINKPNEARKMRHWINAIFLVASDSPRRCGFQKKWWRIFVEKESGTAYVRNWSGGKINPLQKRSGSRFYCSDNIGHRLYRNARTECKCNGQQLCCDTMSVKSTRNGPHTALNGWTYVSLPVETMHWKGRSHMHEIFWCLHQTHLHANFSW